MKRRRTPAGSNHYTLLGVAAALAVAAAAWSFMTPSPPAEVANDPVFLREVVAYETVSMREEEPLVKYQYLGTALPEKLTPDEIVEKRTETSYTELITPATDTVAAVYKGIFYTKPTFKKDGDSWRYIEHATTSPAAFFFAKPHQLVIEMFSTAVAYAATYSGFSTSGDGHIGHTKTGDGPGELSDLSECIAELGLADTDTSSTLGSVQARVVVAGNGSCIVRRGYYPFDTSSIPSGASISDATFSVYVPSKTNGVTTGDNIVLVQGPSGGDFASFGSSAGATSIDLGSITTGAYNNFVMNGTGMSWITPGGTTYLGLREQHDINSSLFTAGNNNMNFYTSEQTGTTQDPTLSVTYTVSSSAFWQFQDF